MVASRANWKGFIKFGEVACAVALYTAASSSERIAFNTLNRATGNRVRREFVDSETGDPVEREAQVKGYETENGDYVVLEPDEVAAAIPDSDKTLKIEAFVPCNEIDDVYFDKPYYLAPDKMGADAFRLLRDGMRKAKVAALARTVLFRRLRTVLIRPHGAGLIGTTLNFDYEVRSSQEAFDDIPSTKIEGEMLDLAKHIINTKKGEFDAKTFDDRYDAAVAELVKAKIEGKALPKKKAPPASKQNDLLQALRESAGMATSKSPKRAVAKADAGPKQPKRVAAGAKRAA
ncbi:non-homologous end joining protein Ku [Mesorhizobium sp. ASY16-5R]|uniref:non-homologous end joining protein Ku n=1 Tax=Mesorhizobium sp. ASY16-5R TaxID=3445772 RepID=UPI003FA127BF